MFLFDTFPIYSNTTQQFGLPCTGEYLRLCPLNVTDEPRQRNMAKIKEEIKTSKIELSDEEVANLSDAEFKTLVIKMRTEMVEYGQGIEGKVKAMKSEIKENV